ncbi:unnamed protein product, partial [Darwinula stevensoni]
KGWSFQLAFQAECPINENSKLTVAKGAARQGMRDGKTVPPSIIQWEVREVCKVKLLLLINHYAQDPISGLNATEITKELECVYKNSISSYHTIPKWVAEFKDSTCGLEDAPQSGCSLTTTTDENVEAMECVGHRNCDIVRSLTSSRVSKQLVSKTVTWFQET